MASRGATTPGKPSSFEPSVWGDFFINYEPQPLQSCEEWMRVRVIKLKEEVCMLFKGCNRAVRKMMLVDVLQHLGLDHHFEEQINTALSEILESEFSSYNLHDVALRFRLLREHGCWISPDVFDKFKDENGSLREDITKEPRGLLSLYNAAHLLVHGETSLEEAIAFARHHLKSMRGSLKSPLAKQVKRALHLPLPRTYRRVETVHFISEYKEDEGHNPILLELAKLDFNLHQHLHLKELKSMTKWWKELSEFIGLSYVRDRVVENYLWSFVVHYEEHFGLARVISAKINVLLTIMDDTHDDHATIEECQMLHEAAQRLDFPILIPRWANAQLSMKVLNSLALLSICSGLTRFSGLFACIAIYHVHRWDGSAISLLPEYLKRFYKELLGNIKEIGDEMATSGNYKIAYIKKQFQNQFSYYLQEAQWTHKCHKPSFDEQVNLGVMTICVPTVSVCGMAAMGDAMPKEALDWVVGLPDAIIASGKIARFMNDIAAFNRVKSKGGAASSVECYMAEHGVTREVAIAKIGSLIEDGWKSLNQARFGDRALLPAVQRVINLALSFPLYYGGGNDAFTFSTRLRETIEILFVNPIPM
ncbi:tau-cadinol synthase isoform X1 [Triticum aestivum]|uniref:tau-cadinol synthase isoform X1 n=1 Tax=Triticum aestivum TaxID=4565 RepID=UPI001D027EE6|nr:tau-cadinol synthase-like isoform X1 [Triticum aestivum]